MADALTLAFIGLGVMGGPMAGHLAKAGHKVTVYNRTTSRSEAWIAANGGTARATPREAALDAEIVFACVGNDDDLRQVTMGVDGAFAGMDREGALLLETPAGPRRIVSGELLGRAA